MDDGKSAKADMLSRETSVGEGQIEQTPSTEDRIREKSSEVHDCLEPNSRPRGPAGYAHLAEFMSRTQLGMVRKYKELSLLNLLYLQAEIHQLRTDWEEEVAANARDTETDRNIWDYHWWAMAHGGEAKGLGRRRWEAWMKLRDRLYEYYDAIQKHERIVALPSPNNDQRELLSEYIVEDDMNGGRMAFLSPELRGMYPEAYKEKWLEDLVVFEHGPESNDGFAMWVVQPVLKAAHHCFLKWGKKPLHEDLEPGLPRNANEKHPGAPAGPVIPLYQYNATGATILNRVLNSIMLILLPCAAIISLNAVHDTNKRVGMICAFSLVCAVGMALCSGASRIEIFAVTAAFMSVQLVFVGQQQGGLGN